MITVIVLVQVQWSEADKEILWPKHFITFSYAAWFWSWERETKSHSVCVCVCVLVCVCVCFRWVLYAFMLNLHPSLQARQNDHNASYNNYMHHLNNSLSLSICLSISPISHLLSLICGCAPVSLTVKYFFYPFACVFVTFFLNFLWTIMYATISL